MWSDTRSGHRYGSHDSAPKPPVVLTIAGYDPSSGAGITADLQVFAAHGLFGVSAITAITVQSTQGVAAVQVLDASWLSRTLENLAADLPITAIKIGMLGSEANVQAIAKFLGPPSPRPGRMPIIFDPILRASSGHEFLTPAALKRIKIDLLPRVNWITPNLPELAFLTGEAVNQLEHVPDAADRLGKRYPQLHIVTTGGDADEPIDVLRIPGGMIHAFRGERVQTTSTHGTGCAFSSALASRLVLGDSAVSAVKNAKAYVTEALRAAPGVGKGTGPLGLLWPLRSGQGVGTF